MPHRIAFRRRLHAVLCITVASLMALAVSSSARAQFTNRLPSPVSAAELESLLRDLRVDQAAIDRALPLHERYFREFRDFEEREVDASLKRNASSPLEPPSSVEDARKLADAQRRIFARAAQIDGALLNEIETALPADAGAKLERLRAALSRRRALAAVPTTGLSRAFAFDLRSAPALASLDDTGRAALAQRLEPYETELLRQLERLAEASFARRIRAAEARAELGVGAMPERSPDVAPDAPPGAEENGWMRKIQEVQRRAGEEMAAIDARIRKLHRGTLASVEADLPPVIASSLRSYLVREAYGSIALSGEYDATRKSAEALRAKGALDDTRWSAVESAVRAHESELRPDLENLLALLDERAARGGVDFMLVPDEAAADNAGVEAARDRCNAIIARNAAALREALGEKPATAKPMIADGRGIDISQPGISIEGGVQIMVVGGDGEAISLGGDDLADSGIVLGGLFGGGNDGTAKPLSREELDRLAERLGFTGDSRAVFDLIVERCLEDRAAAEREDEAKRPKPAAGADGSISVTLSIGEDGAMTVGSDGPADPRALAKALEANEERMFDELKVAADPSKAEVAEAARRARARVRLLVGERGVQTADVAGIIESAALSPEQGAAIADELKAWDESSVPALRAMREEIDRVRDERQEIMRAAESTEDVNATEGGTEIRRAMAIDSAVMEKLQRLDERAGDARAKVAARNRSAIDAIASKLESDPRAAKAIRRGLYRVLEPAAYRIPRDLGVLFDRASGIEGLSAETRATIAAQRAEWTESCEALCEEYAVNRERERAEAKQEKSPGMIPLGALGMNSQARKRLTADIDQAEALAIRRLRELVAGAVGAEKAAVIGELQPRKKRGAPSIPLGR